MNEDNESMELEEYSLDESEESEMEEIEFDTKVDTHIESVKAMFTAAELKVTDKSRHYIVRDATEEYYYLKVNIYTDIQEYSYCLQYFLELKTFTQQLAQTKKDVLRVLNVRLKRFKNMKAKDTMKLLLFLIMERLTALILRRSKSYISFDFSKIFVFF